MQACLVVRPRGTPAFGILPTWNSSSSPPCPSQGPRSFLSPLQAPSTPPRMPSLLYPGPLHLLIPLKETGIESSGTTSFVAQALLTTDEPPRQGEAGAPTGCLVGGATSGGASPRIQAPDSISPLSLPTTPPCLLSSECTQSPSLQGATFGRSAQRGSFPGAHSLPNINTSMLKAQSVF